jgi:hypothetical protein
MLVSRAVQKGGLQGGGSGRPDRKSRGLNEDEVWQKKIVRLSGRN